MYEIRKIHSNEVTEALALALEVFLQFEAPDYKPEGIDTFRRDIVENVEFISKCQQGVCPIYAAFDKGKMIGIIGMRSNRTHINLVFTKKEYHRRGVATSIFQYLLADIQKDNPALQEISLNSSPYGKPFYLHIGFKPQSDEQEIDGIRFTPMKYTIGVRPSLNCKIQQAVSAGSLGLVAVTITADTSISSVTVPVISPVLGLSVSPLGKAVLL